MDYQANIKIILHNSTQLFWHFAHALYSADDLKLVSSAAIDVPAAHWATLVANPPVSPSRQRIVKYKFATSASQS